MRSSTSTSSFLSLFLLAAPQTLLSGLTFANGAPTKDNDGVCHVHRGPPQHNGEPNKDPPVQVDVVVVGGGFSGMSSAYALQQAGLNAVVLEAKETLGGRSRSHKLDTRPGIVELGATWINNMTQPAVFALTEEFGLETIEQYDEGEEVREFIDGTIQREEGDPAEMTEEELAVAEMQLELIAAIEEAAEAIDVEVFDEFPVEEDVSFADWVAQKGLWDHPFSQAVCSQLSSSIVGREPHEIGAHYFFDYIKSGRGLDSLLSAGKDGAQQLMIKEGTTSIVTSIAAAMTPGSVLTNSPVTSIKQKDDTVLVTTKMGKRFKAKKAILAINPTIYSNIDFSPSLPSDKQGLVSESMPGIYAKLALTYTEAWWREAGLVGSFYSMIGPITYAWETVISSLDQYSLTVFVSGDFATRWHALPDSEKEGAIIDHLAKLAGEELADQARDILEINYVEWTKEEYVGGGPTSALGPGMLRKYGETLRAPFEGLHFAGTETAYKWKGYLEGAVTAGQRAAEEVIKAIDVGSKE